MIEAISFASPWVLAALAVLPVIWWLLRVNPPVPRRIAFPAIRLLMGLKQKEQTPTTTPPWLLILRLLLAALLIIAIAGPLQDAAPDLVGDGPVVVIIDDGWAAAPGWDNRIRAAEQLLDQAKRANRPVILGLSAPRIQIDGAAPAPFLSQPMVAADARALLRAAAPQPWPVDRRALADALQARDIPDGADSAWLTDGIAGRDEAGAEALLTELRRLGRLRVYGHDRSRLAWLVDAPRMAAQEMVVPVRRAVAETADAVTVRVIDADGLVLAGRPATFADDATSAEAVFELPDELLRRVARVDVEGQAGAGTVGLVDSRWQLKPVGLVSGGGLESNQPLLSELYYLEKALQPFAQVRRGTIADLIDEDLSVLVLADVGRVLDADRDALEAWIEQGGVLVRFAGPRMAEAASELVPVRLMGGGGRALGGALSWDEPMPFARFAEDTPFAGLVPAEDVRVTRQVLAEPDVDLARKTWARLNDGTPLVTADRRGRGRIVLFHTTANTEWSSLALSGLFVQMLERIVTLSDAAGDRVSLQPLPPLSTIDGFGRLGPVSPNAVALAPGDDIGAVLGPTHPPGLYGDQTRRRALNLGEALPGPTALDVFDAGVPVLGYEGRYERDLTPWFLVSAFVLLIIDSLIAMWLGGARPWRGGVRRGSAAGLMIIGAAAIAAFAFTAPVPARAQQSSPMLEEQRIVEAVKRPHFGYVLTGIAEVDAVSRDGLTGLSYVLRQRTSIEPGFPIGVDLETDPLDFYPLIYWPVTDGQPRPSDRAVAALSKYLRLGGMVILDTRDRSPASSVAQRRQLGSPALRRLTSGLDMPPLVRVQPGHALTQAFYLLDAFPGRYAGGPVWVERYEGDINDGVSSLVIGGNDWASAWALDARGLPLFPVVPGGERQREMAFRFGVNLAMYAMTGNYKADQVHIPSILRRLGRLGPEDLDDSEDLDDGEDLK